MWLFPARWGGVCRNITCQSTSSIYPVTLLPPNHGSCIHQYGLNSGDKALCKSGLGQSMGRMPEKTSQRACRREVCGCSWWLYAGVYRNMNAKVLYQWIQ